MTAALATAAVVPVHASPSLRSEQVTQLVLGEGAHVEARDGDHLRVVTILDQYGGWVHEGYLRSTDRNMVEGWLATAAWSEGAEIETAGVRVRVPHRGRLQLEGDRRVRLPDGSAATITGGRIRPRGEVTREAVGIPPAQWAWQAFGGAPYQWGGITDCGIDCSGLVQTTFLARGMPLPRDARDQVAFGIEVSGTQPGAGDLLFFRGTETEGIAHVAIAASADAIVHATVDTGMVTRESIVAGSRAAPLMERLVAIRRVA